MKFPNRAIVRALWFIRPRYPVALARPMVQRRIRRAIAGQVALESAKSEMAHLVGPEHSDHELTRLGSGYIEHWMWREELRWHPRSVTRLRVENPQILVDAYAQGRGVLVSFVHHGNWTGMFPSLARATGIPVHVLADTLSLTSGGPNVMQHLRVVASAGGLVPTSVGTQGITEHLRTGAVIAVAMDLPGSSTVSFAGRRVRCSAGGVHAARGADAPIVALTGHRDESGPYFSLTLISERSGAEEADQLNARLADVYSDAMLAWPEGAYIPKALWVDEGA